MEEGARWVRNAHAKKLHRRTRAPYIFRQMVLERHQKNGQYLYTYAGGGGVWLTGSWKTGRMYEGAFGWQGKKLSSHHAVAGRGLRLAGIRSKQLASCMSRVGMYGWQVVATSSSPHA